MSKVVESELKKARDILAEGISLSKYIEDNKLGYTSGDSGKICCPVHGEDTPSFFYDDRKKRCNCFGCGMGGTVVELHYHIHKLEDERYTMVKSIYALSKAYKIEIPDLYTRTTNEIKKTKPSGRKRGLKGKDDGWIYEEKLKNIEGKFIELPSKDRFKIACLLDDVWLNRKKAKEVYFEILKMYKK